MASTSEPTIDFICTFTTNYLIRVDNLRGSGPEKIKHTIYGDIVRYSRHRFPHRFRHRFRQIADSHRVPGALPLPFPVRTLCSVSETGSNICFSLALLGKKCSAFRVEAFKSSLLFCSSLRVGPFPESWFFRTATTFRTWRISFSSFFRFDREQGMDMFALLTPILLFRTCFLFVKSHFKDPVRIAF